MLHKQLVITTLLRSEVISIITNVRPSLCQLRLGRKRIFLAPIEDIDIPLILYEYLFYKYFVRQSVGQATLGRNVKI